MNITSIPAAPALTTLMAACRVEAERSLYDFVRLMWPVVEPATEMVDGEAMHAICLHLQAVTEGRIRRLLINVPPGFSKSLITNVFWPAWEWGPRNMPHLRYVTFAYSASLTERDNDRCMRLMTSVLYQGLWGHIVKLEKTGITKIATNHTGWKLATSITGVGTGERGDRLLCDDLNNVFESESQTVRDNTNRWLRETMPTRLNDMRRSAIVNIQQRTHEEDASGTLIGVWEDSTHLMIPMRYEPERHCGTAIGWSDWRTEAGELAWPERFPNYTVDELERTLGEYATAGQLQQRPQPRGGGLIKREWWQIWAGEGRETYPPFEFILATVDPSSSLKAESDPRACTVWGLWRDEFETPRVVWRDSSGKAHETRQGFLGAPRLMLIYAWQDRCTIHDFVLRLIETASRFKVDRMRIEGTANGISVMQEMQRMLLDDCTCAIDLEQLPSGMDKFARLQSVQHLFQEGLIYAPDKTWADMVIEQVSMFPRGSHDDLCDCTSAAVRYMRDVNMALRSKEHSEAETALARHRGQRARAALYPV